MPDIGTDGRRQTGSRFAYRQMALWDSHSAQHAGDSRLTAVSWCPEDKTCGAPDMMSQCVPHAQCAHTSFAPPLAPQYLVSDRMLASCGAQIRVEVIDLATGRICDQNLSDVRFEVRGARHAGLVSTFLFGRRAVTVQAIPHVGALT